MQRWLGYIVAGVVGGLAVGVTWMFIGGLRDGVRRYIVTETPLELGQTGLNGLNGAPAAIYRSVSAGVVTVQSMDTAQSQSNAEFLKGEGRQSGTSTGSGFEVGQSGEIVTNWHVVDGAARVIVGLESGRLVKAKIATVDSSADIAILRIPTGGAILHPLRLDDSSQVRVGDEVVAIGSPFGLRQSLTTGVISGVGRRIQSPSGVVLGDALQTDAPINPGNSGGPLLDTRGRVIGIVAQIDTAGASNGSVGVAFAIPIDEARRVLAEAR